MLTCETHEQWVARLPPNGQPPATGYVMTEDERCLSDLQRVTLDNLERIRQWAINR
jgi:hypothetical protein